MKTLFPTFLFPLRSKQQKKHFVLFMETPEMLEEGKKWIAYAKVKVAIKKIARFLLI